MAPQGSAPATSLPPSLPPSVEEAYRRKCVQLKHRTNEVEESNNAARLRLARIKRQVEKLRIERAFLLEQLAKRTSANVEDSEGSPSPPPTPQDKPLRIKRGHRKASPGADGDLKAPGVEDSPSKKPLSVPKEDLDASREGSRANGTTPKPTGGAADSLEPSDRATSAQATASGEQETSQQKESPKAERKEAAAEDEVASTAKDKADEDKMDTEERNDTPAVAAEEGKDAGGDEVASKKPESKSPKGKQDEDVEMADQDAGASADREAQD